MVTCLDLYYVILRPSEKTYPRAIYIPKHCGIPNAYRLYYMNVKCISLYILECVWRSQN
jgi:hypothetical protein